ncbi:DUF2497 domain-containing protein [Hyphomicrobium sp.]|uniref:DUF2497 domain-containing protein n=1 Tax=Hyphomicrobium sp. TaxID=82 RepID=UPI002E319292|nr:DUF2497 domain-containing protein [Hyphomicrobium sp.]HEX2843580.1 DUF2497 domain-containing protein [Hyphomicrobium sp.]
MNMTEKNGQPSMEEILASIRRIIAEEPSGYPHNGELRGTPIMLKGDGLLEDAGDFDLPAIFRSSPPPATDRQTPLLGRLTDAIRGATTAQPETRNGVNGDSAHADQAASAASSEPVHSGLSSLKPVRHLEAGPTEPLRPVNGSPLSHEAPAASPASGAFPPVTAAATSGADTRRVMAPFKDTHFLRMSAPAAAVPTAAPLPAPVEAVAPAPSPMGFESVAPASIEHSPVEATLASPPPFNADQPAMASPTVVTMPPPPPLPQAEHNALVVVPPVGQEASGTIEDTTADLLRPMLRAWLADNMPRMVEKALHIEIAESVKGPKKP